MIEMIIDQRRRNLGGGLGRMKLPDADDREFIPLPEEPVM